MHSARSIITDDNNSIPNNIPDSIPDNNQHIDFVKSDKIVNNITSSNNDDALSNTASTDIDDMLMQVSKNKQEEYIYYISTKHPKSPSILVTTEVDVSIKLIIQITTLMQKNGNQQHLR